MENVSSGEDSPFLAMMAMVLMLFAAAAAGIILCIMLVATGSNRIRFGLNTETAVAIGCTIASLALFTLLRTPTLHYKWKTTTEGLHFRGLIGGGLIRWNEVVSVETRWVNIITGRRAVVRTHNRIAYVPVQDPALAASVWQHLSRIGKSEGVDLSPEADSLWIEDTDSVPDSIEWTHPKPVRFGRMLAWSILFYALGFAIKSLLKDYRFAGWLLALPVIAIADGVLQGQHKANRVSIDAQGITARTIIRSISVRWSEIRSAKYSSCNLEIRAGFFKQFDVPYLEDDDRSRELILSLIRHLRDRANILLPLPEDCIPEPEEE